MFCTFKLLHNIFAQLEQDDHKRRNLHLLYVLQILILRPYGDCVWLINYCWIMSIVTGRESNYFVFNATSAFLSREFMNKSNYIKHSFVLV